MAAWKPEHGIYMDAKYNLVYPEGATHLDGIPEDVLEFVHPHWGKFPPQHPLVVHIVGIAFFFLWIMNFFGNGSVIYVFLKVIYISICECISKLEYSRQTHCGRQATCSW